MRTVETSLAEFLKTGRIGPIREGMKRSDVRRILGYPQTGGWAYQRGSSPCWYYGSVEIGFYARGLYRDRVDYLQVGRGRDNRFTGWGRLRFHDDGFRPLTATLLEIQRFGRVHGIPLLPIWNKLQNPEPGLLTPGGVCIWLGEDDETGERFFGTFITDTWRWYTAPHMPVGYRLGAAGGPSLRT
jgi:hypothetical protein